eukprot:1116576_1
MPCAYELPPTLREHLTNDHRPDVYIYFWSIGGVCVLITFFLLYPRIRAFYKHAIQIRDERDKTLMPFSHIACLLLVSFPLIASILKYHIFISPISAYTMEFIIKSYEGLVLYSFARLIIMFLGNKNSMIALHEAPKTKFFAVAPFGCCFRPCCKPSTMRKEDFRIIYNLIIQYSLLVPLFNFVLMLRTYEGSEHMLLIIRGVRLLSAMLCFYGLLSMLRASRVLLKEYKVVGKFWCIKGLIVVMILPTVIIQGFETLPEMNAEYDKETMVEAYGAMVSIVCFTGLSIFFLVFFKPEDALYAMHNAENKDYKAAKELMLTQVKKEMDGKKDGYSQVHNCQERDGD